MIKSEKKKLYPRIEVARAAFSIPHTLMVLQPPSLGDWIDSSYDFLCPCEAYLLKRFKSTLYGHSFLVLSGLCLILDVLMQWAVFLLALVRTVVLDNPCKREILGVGRSRQVG